jgi:G3E family GTPase
VKLLIIGGFLGSGKTTTLIRIGKDLASRLGRRVAVIVNDCGEVTIDGKIVREYGLDVTEIGSGCICCTVAGSLMMTLKSLKEGFQPDLVVVEPTGVAIPQQIKEIADAERAVEKVVSVVLVDASRYQSMAGLIRSHKEEGFKSLLEKQMEAADLVLVNKVDIATGEEVKQTEEMVRQTAPNAPVLLFSARTGKGSRELMEYLEREIGDGRGS